MLEFPLKANSKEYPTMDDIFQEYIGIKVLERAGALSKNNEQGLIFLKDIIRQYHEQVEAIYRRDELMSILEHTGIITPKEVTVLMDYFCTKLGSGDAERMYYSNPDNWVDGR